MPQPLLLFVEALSPLHAGTGQSSGAVDLPIARERATDWPYLPGSSLKGSLRDRAEDGETFPGFPVAPLFGPKTADAHEHAGGVAMGDAGLLLLPVRSVAGTFAYATSPLLLRRLARDARLAGLDTLAKAAEASAALRLDGTGACWVVAKGCLEVQVQGKKNVVFEDFDLAPTESGQGAPLHSLGEELGRLLFPDDPGSQAHLSQRLCLVHDDMLTHLARHATDVVTRVAIDRDTKVVTKGALWTEENLPVATVLLALVEPMPNVKTGISVAALAGKLRELTATPIQLGGKATVGRGRCQLQLVGGGR